MTITSKSAGGCDELHGGVVDEHVLQLDVRVVLRDAVDLLAPEARGLEHVGLVHRGHLPAAAAAARKPTLGQRAISSVV